MTDNRFPCPCCGYPTLPSRGEWEICVLCNWEDDGQDDSFADEVRGGANGEYSLSQARENFKKYLVMYSPDNDTRIIPGCWPTELANKQELISKFEELKVVVSKSKKEALWTDINWLEQKLHEITHQKVRQYEDNNKK